MRRHTNLGLMRCKTKAPHALLLLVLMLMLMLDSNFDYEHEHEQEFIETRARGVTMMAGGKISKKQRLERGLCPRSPFRGNAAFSRVDFLYAEGSPLVGLV